MTINMGNKQLIKNIFMNMMAFVIQFIISFYASPLIVAKVGASAYGFIGLANDFLTYASVITTVFNSVAARFIAHAYYQKDYDKANHYFNSLIAANTALTAVFCLVGVLTVWKINLLFNVPTEILTDVQITFSLVFGGYCISVITNVFTTSTFVTNRTDIQGLRNIVVGILKFALTITFLSFISIKIYWVPFASLCATIFAAVWNISLTKKLTPEISISLRSAKWRYAKELAKSGCWMAFTSLSAILMRGLDLIISNKLIGAHEMGLVSIARTIPNNLTNIINTIAPIFTPMLIAYYTKRDQEGLIKKVNDSVYFMALIMFVPIAGFLVFSQDFYTLWQSSLSTEEINIVIFLSSCTAVQAFFNASTATMAQLSVVTNKLKIPVFMSFGCGLLNAIIEFCVIKYAGWGIYGIAIPEAIIMILRYILFNSFYGEYVLKAPFKTFLRRAIRVWVSIPILLVTFILIKKLLHSSTWIGFIVSVGVCGVVGYAEMILMYYRSEAIQIFRKIFKHSKE